jgi:hypothetical protein
MSFGSELLSGLTSILYTGNASSAIANNILNDSGSIDTGPFSSFSIQVKSTGTSGTFIFEGSNNDVDFQPIPVYNQALVVRIPIITAITATVSSIIYEGSCNFKYIRLRIVSTIGGGNLITYSNLLRHPLGTVSQVVSNGTAANLLATVSGTVTATVASTSLTPSTTLGYATHTNFKSSAGTNSTLVKATAGTIGHLNVYNSSSSVRYLKFYNKATAPTIGTDTAVLIIPIPPRIYKHKHPCSRMEIRYRYRVRGYRGVCKWGHNSNISR